MFKCSGFKLDRNRLAITPAQEKIHSDGVEVAGTQNYLCTKGTSKLYREVFTFHHCREDSHEGTLSDKYALTISVT